jgi:hypothetical protein
MCFLLEQFKVLLRHFLVRVAIFRNIKDLNFLSVQNLAHSNFVFPVLFQGMIGAKFHLLSSLYEIFCHLLVHFVVPFYQIAPNVGILGIHAQLNSFHRCSNLFFRLSQPDFCNFHSARLICISTLLASLRRTLTNCSHQRLLDINFKGGSKFHGGLTSSLFGDLNVWVVI